MEKFRLKHSSWATVYLLLPLTWISVWGCAGVHQSPQEREIAVASLVREPVLSLEPKQVADGGLVRIEVLIPSYYLEGSSPEELRKLQVRGKGPKGEFPFYRSSVSAGLFEALLGIPFGQKPGAIEVPVRIALGRKLKTELKAIIPVVAGEYAAETLSVDPRHVNPGPQAIERMRREASEIGRLYRNSEDSMHWSGAFEIPIQSPITSPFGTKRIYNGEMQSFHQGLDLKAPVGTPIRAPAGGRVVMAKDLYLTGNTVILDHGHGLLTVYAHLNEFKVKVGALLKKGDLLGLSGVTGRASGPHLHWGAVVHRTKFNPIDLTRIVR